MPDQPYEVTDRRPIAARNLPFFQKLATKLAAAGLSANAISVAGAICALIGGAALLATPYTSSPLSRLLWLTAALMAQLRLQANLLDGMVAIAANKASAVGELYNEVPDRISDPAILIALGYAAGGIPALGWLAALLAVLTAYIRMLGKAAGTGSDFVGPFAKQQRMFVVTILFVFIAATPTSWQQWHPVPITLAILIVGTALTCVRRLARIAKKLGTSS
jgi:phosphatidylglycerophosphate synthase